MCRRYQYSAFTVLTLAVFTLEVTALTVLALTFLLRPGGDGNWELGFRDALVAAVVITALALTAITGFALVYGTVSERQQQRREDEIRQWTEIWVRTVLRDTFTPPLPFSSAAAAALLNIREVLDGEKGDRVAALLKMGGVTDTLFARARATRAEAQGSYAWPLPFIPRRRLTMRLDALDGLAKARAPEASMILLPLLRDRVPAIRKMALRAIARSIAAIPEGPIRSASVTSLIQVMPSECVARGVVDEVLHLLENAASQAVEVLLIGSARDESLLCSALDAAGRLRLVHLAPLVANHAPRSHPTEIRAAAIRALSALSILPAEASSVLVDALSDEEEAVRIQAAHAAFLLSGSELVSVLTPLLADSSWWVRQAAATTLMRSGTVGRAVLLQAATSNADPFAQQMAIRALLDRGVEGVDGPRLRRHV